MIMFNGIIYVSIQVFWYYTTLAILALWTSRFLEACERFPIVPKVLLSGIRSGKPLGVRKLLLSFRLYDILILVKSCKFIKSFGALIGVSSKNINTFLNTSVVRVVASHTRGSQMESD